MLLSKTDHNMMKNYVFRVFMLLNTKPVCFH